MAQIKPLSEELQKIANDELGEVPARIPDDLKAFKEWIQQQPHLKANTDDQFLIQFLRGSKYSLERAKDKIEHYYAFATKFPQLFHTTDVDEVHFRKYHNTGSVVFLPRPLYDNGARIAIVRLTYSPHEFSPYDLMKQCVAMMEIVKMDDPYACIQGFSVVIDFALATMAHILQITPLLAKTALAYYTKAFASRFKAICIINLPSYAEQAIKMFLTYAPEKLRQRVFVCRKNTDDLTRHIPLKYLTQEYGGENGCLEQICSEYNTVWDKYREYFKQNANYGTDERLRLGKPLILDDDLIVDGSFRRLEVD